jgi:hypothetical protein
MTNKKNGCNKKKSYHPLCMQNEWNGADSVRDNGTVNTLVLVLRTRL